MTKTKVVALLACICCMLWGSATPTIKVGYSLMHIDSLDTASQIVFAGIRFTIAGILVLIFASIKDKKPALPTKKVIKYSIPTFITQTFIQYFFLCRTSSCIRRQKWHHYRHRKFHRNFLILPGF